MVCKQYGIIDIREVLGKENNPNPVEFRLADSTFESIDKFFKGYENIQYGWSNNKKYAAFPIESSSYTTEKKPGTVKFVWKVGQSEPVAVKGVDNCTSFGSYYWSPDDNYFVHDKEHHTQGLENKVSDACFINISI